MFDKYSVKQLRKMVRAWKEYHNIKGFAKMRKSELIKQMEERFVIDDNKLFLKTANAPSSLRSSPSSSPSSSRSSSPVRKAPPAKKRITPMYVGSSQPKVDNAFTRTGTTKTKGQQRVDNTVASMEKYYKEKGNKDEYPDLGF